MGILIMISEIYHLKSWEKATYSYVKEKYPNNPEIWAKKQTKFENAPFLSQLGWCLEFLSENGVEITMTPPNTIPIPPSNPVYYFRILDRDEHGRRRTMSVDNADLIEGYKQSVIKGFKSLETIQEVATSLKDDESGEAHK